jgi:heme iron utilization protein
VLISRDGEAALAEAEERLITEVNALGQPALARLAGHAALRPAWRAVGLDSEGLDLAAGGRAARAQFATLAHDPGAWRARLEQLLAAG